MPNSLIEELPKIVANGKREAGKILERLSSEHRLTLQTNELVLPDKDVSGLYRGKEIPDVQEDINLLYPVLKRYRNAVFHIQKNYWPDKWESLILDHTSAEKIQKIHKQVGLFLLKQLQSE